MSKIGRNDPCPCGSDKKYKKCCLASDIKQSAQHSPAAEINQALTNAFAGQQFESQDDMQVFADHKAQQHNNAPQEALGGFSPDQLQTLLYAPIGKQELIQWHDDIDAAEVSNAPIVAIFHSVQNYLTAHKAKATARGNLPAALVKQVFNEYKTLFGEDERDCTFQRVNKEADFRELHVAKIIFEHIGLLRLDKGHFVLTNKSLDLSDGDLFKLLFNNYVEKYCWGYEDLYPEVDFFQTATWYSLVMLNRLSGTCINAAEFSEDFFRIFPMVLNEFEDEPHFSSLDSATAAYRVRLLNRFWRFFGLVALEGKRFPPQRQ